MSCIADSLIECSAYMCVRTAWVSGLMTSTWGAWVGQQWAERGNWLVRMKMKNGNNFMNT